MRDDLNKYNTLTCPCCKEERHLSQFSHLDKFNKQYSYEHMISVFQSAKEGHLQWACDLCLKDKTAIMGVPEQQNWGGFAYPYFAFYDQNKVCSNCSQHFVFKKEEQQYWYEQLKFIVWSEAKDCAQCRKDKRTPRVRNTIISEFVKNLEKDNIDQVEQLVDLYLEINKVDKAKFYLAVVRKNTDSKADNEVQQRLGRIKDKITAHNKTYK